MDFIKIHCKYTPKIILSKGHPRHVTSRDAKKCHFFAFYYSSCSE